MASPRKRTPSASSRSSQFDSPRNNRSRNTQRAQRAQISYTPSAAGRASVRTSAGEKTSSRSSARLSSRDAYVTRTVGDIRREQRRTQRVQATRRISGGVVAVLIVIALVLLGAFALYLAPIAKVQHITIKGAQHLTEDEMIALADIPDNTTLLRVDTARIEQNCLRDAWIKDVSVNRVFPDTLELVVTERQIAATVAVPTGNSAVTRIWAIAQDKTWLMPIPEKESQAAATVSEQVYIDAENVLQIVDVPYGTSPEIGAVCTDSNVNNALAIVSGMTTELAKQVVRVSATDAESTILTLDNGVEIAFGAAENIRDKERVCLALLSEHEGSIAYINVRTVTSPTWRSL